MAEIKPDCRDCSHLSIYRNCGAMLQGLIKNEAGEVVGAGTLNGPATPTSWAKRCGQFDHRGWRMTKPTWGPEWQ